ncbi:Holliday junction DNA helicase subunit RuvA [Leucobacter luti]|uniref:Holliday junction branch migration protein RuvA n=1 Tax=Leucobacter luti TaxID=340320 RepID=UPI00104412BE|nr:Holliday junction branch migration protein RuvA [Leucobacter luti]MCW2287941.1 Holliday junction DNA helicase RuvA [Leucobacter luti]TCK45897.1 Holliday junction DNA helicase subunit RuvA [Leucobacter luti]
MIASIRGPVLASGAGWAVIGLGGLGMRVEVPSGRVPQPQPGEDLALLTSLVVREDSLTLFGFHSEAELEVFGHLIAVSGVGPRSALGVLSALAPAEIAEAVASEDEKPFRKVSGIGPKTAKLIVVSLAGKLANLDLGEPSVPGRGPAAASVADAVADGLVGLGWGAADAQLAVADALDAGAPESNAELLRAALALLQAGRPGSRTAGGGR